MSKLAEKKDKNVHETMLSSFQEKFKNPKAKKVFDNYEEKYNEKILEKIKKFNEKNLEENDIYDNFFKDIALKAKENSKIFSKLKHE